MAIIGNIGGGEGALPSLVEVKTGANAVPAGKYWKVKNYSQDILLDSDRVSQKEFTHSLQTPEVNVGTGDYVVNYTVPVDGELVAIHTCGQNTIASFNRVATRVFSLLAGRVVLNHSIDLPHSVGTYCATSWDRTTDTTTMEFPVEAGQTIQLRISYEALGGAGGNTIGYSTFVIKPKSSGNGEFIATAGQTVDGNSYLVEEYDL